MSLISRVQAAILQMNGGQFQKLGDAYLSKKLSLLPNSLGSQAGTEKTTKGTPDTYFMSVDGKYIFVMYTTDQNIFVKLKADLLSCFDFDKTGLIKEKIQTIILVHTSSNINAGQQEALNQIASENGVELKVIGIDTLAIDIINRYKDLSRDFLNIELDTHQIMELDDFIKSNDERTLAAPLNTVYEKRDSLLSELIGKIESASCTIVYGHPGVGKTRLCIEAATIFSRSHGSKLYCVKSNNLDIYDDIVNTFNQDEEYIVFIDDANTLSGLAHFLELCISSRGKLKLLCTIRDYVFQSTYHLITDFLDPTILQIPEMSSDEIQRLVSTNFNITNGIYLDQIVRIANGNPRLAILAGKLAVDSQDLRSIQDASKLFDAYYCRYLKAIELDGDTKLLVTASILSFFGTYHFDFFEIFEPLISHLGISKADFLFNIRSLHDMEIVTIYEDQVAKIVDQSMGNFLLKKVFVDSKLINLASLITQVFDRFKSQIISAMNALLGVFRSDELFDYIRNQVRDAYLNFANKDGVTRFDFLTTFPPFFDNELIDLMHETIQGIDDLGIAQTDLMLAFNMDRKKNIEKYYHILFGLYESTSEKSALDLAMIMLDKFPVESSTAFSKTLIDECGIDIYSQTNDYHTLRYILIYLVECSVGFSKQTINKELLSLAEYLLKSEYNPVKNEGMAFRYYRIRPNDSSGFINLREISWMILLTLVENVSFQTQVNAILRKYYSHSYDDKSLVLACDAKHLQDLIRLLSCDILSHCLLVEHILDCFPNDKSIRALSDTFFHNKDYLNCKMLIGSRSPDIDYFDLRQNRVNEISDFAKNASLTDIHSVLFSANLFLSEQQDTYQVIEGVEILTHAVLEDREKTLMLIESIKQYPSLWRRADTRVILSLIFSLSETIEKAISTIESLPREIIPQLTLSLFLFPNHSFISFELAQHFLRFLDTDFLYSDDFKYYFPYIELDKYSPVYENFSNDAILKIASNTVARQSTNNTSLIDTIFNKHTTAQKILDNCSDKTIELLYKIYLNKVNLGDNFDYDGTMLQYFTKRNKKYFYHYVDAGTKAVIHHLFYRIQFIWDYEFIDEYINYVFEKTLGKKGKMFYLSFNLSDLFVDEHNGKRSRNLPKKIAWIKSYIVKNIQDASKISLVFEVVAFFPTEFRIEIFTYLSQLSVTYEVFEKINLEKRLASWSGSQVPLIENKITYAKALYTLFSGLSYTKHRERINKLIDFYQKEKKQVKIDEILRGY